MSKGGYSIESMEMRLLMRSVLESQRFSMNEGNRMSQRSRNRRMREQRAQSSVDELTTILLNHNLSNRVRTIAARDLVRTARRHNLRLQIQFVIGFVVLVIIQCCLVLVHVSNSPWIQGYYLCCMWAYPSPSVSRVKEKW